MARGSDSGDDSEESEPETEWLFPSDVRSDSTTRPDDSTRPDTRADAGDRIMAFEKSAFGVDDSPAFGTDTDDRTHAVSVVVPAPEALGEMPPTERPRKRFLVLAAVVVLLGVSAVGVVTAVGRNDGGKSSPRVAPPVRSQASTSTASRAEATTTIAPAPAPSAPISFTVHSSCGGRDCEVAVRERPSTAAKTVRSLRSGEVVQISCSTHGDRIDDRDTGQQSDVWYRLATGGYSSALYLQGPTLQDCG